MPVFDSKPENKNIQSRRDQNQQRTGPEKASPNIPPLESVGREGMGDSNSVEFLQMRHFDSKGDFTPESRAYQRKVIQKLRDYYSGKWENSGKPLTLHQQAIQAMLKYKQYSTLERVQRQMGIYRPASEMQVEPADSPLEDEADRVADHVVANKQEGDSTKTTSPNIQKQNIIQWKIEGDKKPSPDSKPSTSVVLEVGEGNGEILEIEGKGRVYLRTNFLQYAQTSKPIGLENAPPSIDPHLLYHREFKVQTEDGRRIYFMFQGRTNAHESKIPSIHDQGPSAFAYRILVERSDGEKAFFENKIYGSEKESSIFELISGIQDVNPILFLPRQADELFFDVLIAKADTLLLGFPKVERNEKGWGADDYEGGIGKSYGSDETEQAEFLDVGEGKEIGKDDERLKPWGEMERSKGKSWSEMSDSEKRYAAWKAFSEEFSWDRVAKETAMVLAVALGMYLAQPFAPFALALLSVFSIYSGIMELVQPFLEGASPEVMDWIHGGLFIILGASTMVVAAFLAGYVSAGAAATASAIAIFSAIGLALSSIIKSATEFSDAVAAPTEAEMQKMAQKSAHDAERAIVETVMTLPILKQVKDIFSTKTGAPAEEALSGKGEKTTKSKAELSEKDLSVERVEPEIIEEVIERAPGWVEVLNVREKVIARAPHVLEIEGIVTRPDGVRGFKGCHTKGALSEYVTRNPGSSFELFEVSPSPSGVYEAKPVITEVTGAELTKLNNGGKSSFFPDSWNYSKIIDEVVFAIENNHGRYLTGSSNQYFGYSSDGLVEIHFYLKSDGSIGSYFPKKIP